MRFTHANRHCPDHPFEALKRCEDEFVLNQQPEEQSTEILKWLQKYREERQQQLQQLAASPSPSTTTSKKTPKRSSSSKCNNDENKKRVVSRSTILSPGEVHQSHENFLTPTRTFSRKGLMCEVDMNAGTAMNNSQTSTPLLNNISTKISEPSEILGSPISTTKPKYCRPKVILWKEPTELDDDPLEEAQHIMQQKNIPEIVQQKVVSSPKKSFNPKKKWLREAWQDGCRPLDENSLQNQATENIANNWQMNENPNQNRPSVLVIMGQKNLEKEYQNL
jgi:hypothetical protein